MALMRLFVFLIFSAVAFGDPISVTIFNQTTETTAETRAIGTGDQQCTASNVFSSTCHSQITGIAGQTIAAYASTSIMAIEYPQQAPRTYMNESVSAGNYLSYGVASASLDESVLWATWLTTCVP